MPHPNLAVVTGAFSYTGRYVTRRLLDQGVRARTLTLRELRAGGRSTTIRMNRLRGWRPNNWGSGRSRF